MVTFSHWANALPKSLLVAALLCAPLHTAPATPSADTPPDAARHKAGRGSLAPKTAAKAPPAKKTPKPKKEKSPTSAPASVQSPPGGDPTGAPHGEAACAPTPPLDRFFNLGGGWAPQATQGGVVFLKNIQGLPQMHYQSRATGPAQVLMPLDKGVAAFSAHPSRHWVAGWEGGGRALSLRLHSAPPSRVKVPKAGTLLSARWDPSDDTLVITTAEPPQWHRLDPRTLQWKLGGTLPKPMVVADVAKPPAGGTKILFHTLPDLSPGFMATWEKINGFSTVLTQREAGAIEQAFFGPGLAAVVWLNRTVDGLGQVFFSPLASTPSVQKPLTSQDASVLSINRSPSQKEWVYLLEQDGALKFIALELSPKGATGAQRVVPELVGWSDSPPTFHSETGFFFEQSTPNHPPQIWHWDTQALNLWTPWTGTDPKPPRNRSGCWSESMTLQTSKGSRVYRPIGQAGKQPFLILEVPDLSPRFRPEVAYLNKQGVGVALVTSAEAFGAVKKELIAQGLADPSRVHSQTRGEPEPGLESLRAITRRLSNIVDATPESRRPLPNR